MSRIDITHLAETLVFERGYRLQLEPGDIMSAFDVLEVADERLSSVPIAQELVESHPCNLERLAIDDIFSGQPVEPTWIGDANPDYTIYLDVYAKTLEEPVYTLTQNAKSVSTERFDSLQPSTVHELSLIHI